MRTFSLPTPRSLAWALLLLVPPAHAADITSTWTGGSANWTNTGSWSPALTPGTFPNNGSPSPTYDVTLSNGSTITLTQDVTILGLLVSNGALSVTGSTLNVSSLTITGGSPSPTRTGSGTLVVSGLTTLTAGAPGQFAGATLEGGTTKAQGGLLLNGPNGATVDFNNASTVLENSGTANWISGIPRFASGARLSNLATGTFTTNFDGTTSGSGVFSNAGTFTKSGGSGSTIIAGVTFNNTGTVNANSGTLSFGSSFTQTTAGAVLNLGGGSVSTSSALDINGGSVTGSGTITGNVAVTSAKISPAGTLGGTSTMVVAGDLTITSASTLEIDITGTTAGSGYDVITEVGSTAFVRNGTLSVRLPGAFRPTSGDHFIILTSNQSMTGQFTNVSNGRVSAADGSGSFAINATGGTQVDLFDFIATNRPPTIATIADAVTNEDTPTSGITVDVADLDAGDTLTVSAVVQSGTVGLVGSIGVSPVTGGSGTRTITVTPTANTSGSAVIRVTVNDGTNQGNNTTFRDFTLTVNPVNDAPVATAASPSTNEDTTLTGTVTGSDVEASPLTFAKVSDPGHGSVTVNANGSFSYVPVLNYNGPDSFTFKANDGALDSVPATVSITVIPVNDAPVATAASAAGNEDSPLTASVAGSDVDGNTLTFAKASDPAHGSVTVNANGSFSYVPVLNYNGPDSFTFKANDGQLDSAAATITLTVNPVNDAPVASNGVASGNEDTTITGTAGASDVDGDTLTFAKVTDPAHGSVTVSGTGSFSYVPSPDYNGPDSFTFKANDGTVDSAVKTITITVNPVNDAPVATIVSAAGDEDSTITGTVTGTDIDAGDTLTFAIVTSPAHGTASVSPSGAFSYTPAMDYNGSDSFTFEANDGTLDSVAATVTLTVNPVNDAPAVVNGLASGDEDAIITGTLSGTDVDGDTLTFAKVNVPAHGTVVITGSSFSYTPTADYNGPDIFTFKANDGMVDSAPGTITLTLGVVNDAPVAVNVSASGSEDSPVTGTLNATDVDGDTLSFIQVGSPAHGTVVITGSGFTYTPEANFNGSDSFTFKANDTLADSNVATVTLSISAANDAPTISAIADVVATSAGASLIPFTVGDLETAATALTVSASVTSATNPALLLPTGISFSGSGASRTLNLAPVASQLGSAVIEVTVSDGVLSASDTFTFTLNGPEISVEQVPGTPLADGGIVAFGDVIASLGKTLPFTIKNTGNRPLTGVSLSKLATAFAPSYKLTAPANPDLLTVPGLTLNAGESATFAVELVPLLGNGSYPCSLQIVSSDTDEAVFDIRLTASVITGTPPVLTLPTTAATAITFDGATLNVTVDPKGSERTVSFEYGLTTAYGITETLPATVNGSTAVALSKTITGLLPHNTYHFRVRAVGLQGAATTSDRTFTTVNRAPTPLNDVFEVLPGGSVVLNVLVNDTDPDGDALTLFSASAVFPSTAGTVAGVGNTRTFTASSAFTGATFNYTVLDDFGRAASATVTLQLAPCTLNPASVTKPSNANSYDVTVTTALPWIVSKPAALNWVSVSPVSGAGIVPGTVNISLEANTTTSVRTGTLTIGGKPHTISQAGLPVISTSLIAFSSAGSSGFTFQGSVNASGDSRTVSFEWGEVAGTYGNIAAGGPLDTPAGTAVTGPTFTTVRSELIPFTAQLTPHGTYHARIRVTSEGGFVTGPDVAFTLPNRAPVANPDTFGVIPGTTATLPVLANDTDPDGDALGVVNVTPIITPSTAGTAVLFHDGVTFTAASTFSGATCTYTMGDELNNRALSSVAGTITLTLGTCSIDPPSVTKSSAATTYPIAVTSNALWSVAVNSSFVSVSPASGNGNGTVNVTLAANTGSTPLTHTITIGGQTHTITQTGRPVVTTQPVTLTADGGVLLNGTVNAAGESRTASFEWGLIAGTYGTIAAAGPTGSPVGTAVTGTTTTPVSSEVITPTQMAPHATYHFRTRATSQGGFVTGADFIFTAPNRAPVANPDTITLLPETSVPLSVLANDTDADSDALSFVGTPTLNPTTAGTIIPSGTGRVFNASAAFNGATCTYTVSDGHGGTATGTVTLTRGTCAIDPPTATMPSSAATYTNVVAVTSNLPWAVTGLPPWATATTTPSPSVGNGSVSLTLQAFNLTTVGGRSATIRIGGQPFVLTQQGRPIVTTVGANGIGATTATLTGTVDGRGFARALRFEYDDTAHTALGQFRNSVDAVPVVSGTGLTSVTLSVTGLSPHTSYGFRVVADSGASAVVGTTRTFTTLNRAPTAVADSFVVLPGGAVVLDELANDTDPDGDSLTSISSTASSPASAGRVSVSGSSRVFTASPTFSSATYTYTISDGFGGTSTATVTLTLGTSSINPTSISQPSAGTTYPVAVTANGGWAASVVSGGFITLTQPASGAGNGNVQVTLGPNPGLAARTGTVNIAGKLHSITQAGVLPPSIPAFAELLPTAIVSGFYSLPVPTVNAPVTYTLTGLPNGLAINQTTGIISGKPTESGTFNASVRAINLAGSTATRTFQIRVLPLPTGVVGVFHGLVPRDPALNGNLGSRLELTTTAMGTVKNGRLITGATQLTVSGTLDATVADPNHPQLHVTIPRTGSPALSLDVTFDHDLNTLSGTVTDGTVTSPPLSAWRNVWNTDAPATAYATSYSFALDQTDPNTELPQGYGFGTFTVNGATGNLSASVKLPDGNASTNATHVGPQGQVLIYQPFYSNQGSFAGVLTITPGTPVTNNSISGSCSWSKPVGAAADTLYGKGFGPINLTAAGSAYQRPASGSRVLNLPATANNASIRFSLGGLDEEGAEFTQLFSITASGLNNSASFASPNPNKVAMPTLTASTGAFVGSFFLDLPGTTLDRTVTYQGQIVRAGSTSSGYGYFLLPQLPVGMETLTTSPKLSGRVELDAAQ